MYFYVGGHFCSGKSTLSKLLRDRLEIKIVDFRSGNKELIESYIRDIHSIPDECSFEAQIAFLANKISAIKASNDTTMWFAVERSVDEDVEIFCKYFKDCGYINHRAWETYVQVYNELAENCPMPEFGIFCQCSRETLNKRMRARPRDYQENYPQDFIDKVYSDTIEIAKSRKYPTFLLDTDKFDIESHADEIIAEIRLVLGGAPQSTSQPLFEIQDKQNRAIKCLRSINQIGLSKWSQSSPSRKILRAKTRQAKSNKSIYLAAPFTDRAARVAKDPGEIQFALFPEELKFEEIPEGGYRGAIESLATNLALSGNNVVLPHRDINKWGQRVMTPREVANECLTSVLGCDYLIALIGKSFGSHVEVGVAIGANIPVLIVMEDGADISFFGEGVASSDFAKFIKITSVDKITQSDIASMLSLLREFDLKINR